jgi:large subunit ribosomal protein L18
MRRLFRKAYTRTQQRYRRHLRVRKKISGTHDRPRLVVYRSLKHIYAQLVDDTTGKTLCGVSDRSKDVKVDGGGKVARGHAVGAAIAQRAKEIGISKVTFDRAGYRFHGRVKAVADGARKGGLEF